MRPTLLMLVTLVMGWAESAQASPVRLVAADDRGVTLQLTAPAWTLASGPDGRARLQAQGLDAPDLPGRAALPSASVLVALPPGARASVRVLAGDPEQTRDGVRLEIVGKPVFRPGDKKGELVPSRDEVPATLDGAWPRSPVEVGEPFNLRRQRMAAVRINPFRYDPALQRLWSRRSITVRVDFSGARAAAAPAAGSARDGSWEAVLREAVVNYDQARGWRLPAHPATRRGAYELAVPGRAQAIQAFDEDNPEVRVKVDSSGVYQLSYALLSAAGYPAGVPIAQVSVHRHEFLENATPPYETIELPIEVDDRNGNGVFDANDRILVWVQSWASRAHASWAQRVWGDAEVIYATSVTRGGLRLPTRPGWRNVAGLVPLASYPYHQRNEKNLQYFLFPPDTLLDQFHWTNNAFYFLRDDTIHFAVNHIDTTHAVTVTASWCGRKDTAHYTWAQYRNGGPTFVTIADSMVWSGRDRATASVTLPGSTLGEGNVNTFRSWGKQYGTAPDPVFNSQDFVGLDYIDTDYWRSYRALGRYLSANSAGGLGEIQIQAAGFFGADVRVYDVSDSLQPVRLAVDASHVLPAPGGESTIEFQDSVAAGAPHQYVVFSTPKTLPADHYGAVTRRQLTARSQGDYLLVVPEAFLPAVDALVTLRTSEGHNVVVAPFESICDEFNGGRRSSYAIKRFVRYGYENWNARFLLLVGDASLDPQNLAGEASVDFIPTQRISGPVVIPFGYEIISSDPWYVCMNNCDLNSGTPVLQDLFVGRLPAHSLAEAQGMVDKIVAYENFSSGQTWRRKIMLASDDQYSGATFLGDNSTTDYCRRPEELVFKHIEETIAGVIKNDAGLQQAVIDTFSQGDILGNIACINPTAQDSCPCRDYTSTVTIARNTVTPLLFNHLNDGRVWWNFQGHANQGVLTHEYIYQRNPPPFGENDKDFFLNDGKPFLFSAFSCHANAFAEQNEFTQGPAIGEDMVDLPSRGAIATWASTGYEILPTSNTNHINIAWARAMFESPPHDDFLGQTGARVLLGESTALALARYVPTVQYDANQKGIALTYHLLGDPATRLSIGDPEAVVLANQLPVSDGQPVRLHTLGDTLRLEATLVSNVALRQISLERRDVSGTVPIPATDYTLTPAFPDTAGGRRYQLSYAANLLASDYHYVLRTTDRYGVQGSFDVYFQFLTQLRLDQTVLHDGDLVPANGNLSLQVLSPKPLTPASDLTLFVNNAPQAFTATPAPGDASGREWILSWNHAPYPANDYTVRLDVAGGTSQTRLFKVGGGGLKVNGLVAFPNPFDDFTVFSFVLASDAPADVQIRVFTSAGHMVYEWIGRGLATGYHQIPWKGVDAEGSSLANGVYLYKLIAVNSGGKDEQLGRLVRLRKPRRASSS